VNAVVSQALATGLPVIATRHSGLPEQVIDGTNGFLVDEGNYVALAEKILELGEHSEFLPAFGRNGRLHVVDRYDASTLIPRQIAVYERLAWCPSGRANEPLGDGNEPRPASG
jgi:colanic acid/amylovoran biosynthesis glycosyltransferase